MAPPGPNVSVDIGTGPNVLKGCLFSSKIIPGTILPTATPGKTKAYSSHAASLVGHSLEAALARQNPASLTCTLAQAHPLNACSLLSYLLDLEGPSQLPATWARFFPTMLCLCMYSTVRPEGSPALRTAEQISVVKPQITVFPLWSLF